jgi:hypothetical protein
LVVRRHLLGWSVRVTVEPLAPAISMEVRLWCGLLDVGKVNRAEIAINDSAAEIPGWHSDSVRTHLKFSRLRTESAGTRSKSAGVAGESADLEGRICGSRSRIRWLLPASTGSSGLASHRHVQLLLVRGRSWLRAIRRGSPARVREVPGRRRGRGPDARVNGLLPRGGSGRTER